MEETKIEIREIQESDEDQLIAARRSFIESDQDMELAFYYDEAMDFKKYIQILENAKNGIGIPSEHVASSIFFAFVNGELAGRVSIRHKLNEFLEKIGGHIGYMVIVKHRNKGVASQMLKYALNYAREKLGIKRILVTCDEGNIASQRTIEKNGGVFENTYLDDTLKVPKRRYWFT